MNQKSTLKKKVEINKLISTILGKLFPTTQMKLSGQKFQQWIWNFAEGGDCENIVPLIL